MQPSSLEAPAVAASDIQQRIAQNTQKRDRVIADISHIQPKMRQYRDDTEAQALFKLEEAEEQAARAILHRDELILHVQTTLVRTPQLLAQLRQLNEQHLLPKLLRVGTEMLAAPAPGNSSDQCAIFTKQARHFAQRIHKTQLWTDYALQQRLLFPNVPVSVPPTLWIDAKLDHRKAKAIAVVPISRLPADFALTRPTYWYLILRSMPFNCLIYDALNEIRRCGSMTHKALVAGFLRFIVPDPKMPGLKIAEQQLEEKLAKARRSRSKAAPDSAKFKAATATLERLQAYKRDFHLVLDLFVHLSLWMNLHSHAKDLARPTNNNVRSLADQSVSEQFRSIDSSMYAHFGDFMHTVLRDAIQVDSDPFLQVQVQVGSLDFKGLTVKQMNDALIRDTNKPSGVLRVTALFERLYDWFQVQSGDTESSKHGMTLLRLVHVPFLLSYRKPASKQGKKQAAIATINAAIQTSRRSYDELATCLCAAVNQRTQLTTALEKDRRLLQDIAPSAEGNANDTSIQVASAASSSQTAASAESTFQTTASIAGHKDNDAGEAGEAGPKEPVISFVSSLLESRVASRSTMSENASSESQLGDMSDEDASLEPLAKKVKLEY